MPIGRLGMDKNHKMTGMISWQTGDGGNTVIINVITNDESGLDMMEEVINFT